MPHPILLSTWSFGVRGHAVAWPPLASGGSSLDAVEAVCRVIDLDPEVDSVGFGGLPDRDGNVSVDGCVMLSPAQAAGVCAVRRHQHPVSIARRVMERTAHVLIAGEGADEFADANGFDEAELLAETARARWASWLEKPDTIDQSRDRGYAARPVDDGAGGGVLFDDEAKWRHHDTIGSLAIDANGVLAGACSSSGLPFKLPGRVGDSPIIGQGLYVDPAHGAVVGTGAGELIMGVCGSFLGVECMRRGATPAEALHEVLQRIADAYTLDEHHQAAFIALRPDGTFASAALRDGYRTCVVSEGRDEVVQPDVVLLESGNARG